MTICFYLQDGVEVLDFAGPLEVFALAGFKVFTVSLRKEPIITQGILKIVPDYGIDDAPAADMLAFFGGEADRASRDPVLIDWIKSRQASTSYFFSVCTGAFIMGRAGVLDGFTATTYHANVEALQQLLPQTQVLEKVRFVDDGSVITTAGISAGIDGALHVVGRFKGQDAAKKVAAEMEYDKWVPGEGLIRIIAVLLFFFAFFQFRVNAQSPDVALGKTPTTICFYLQDGVEVLDFAGPMEVFSYAGFKVFTVSRKKEPITSQGILKIMPDYGIDDAPPADIMAFFGGNPEPPSHDPALIAWIKSRRATTGFFFSVCTGAFILGRAGVLDSLSSTTHYAAIEQLQKDVPQTHVLAHVRVVDNGHVIITSGVSAGIDGALHLVSRLRGEDVAKKVAEWIEYDKYVPNQGLVLTNNVAR